MNGDGCSSLMGTFEQLQEAEFDAGWCEGAGIVGGLGIEDTPSIEEFERIYRLAPEPAACAA